jgi:hypothetical protein
MYNFRRSVLFFSLHLHAYQIQSGLIRISLRVAQQNWLQYTSPYLIRRSPKGRKTWDKLYRGVALV